MHRSDDETAGDVALGASRERGERMGRYVCRVCSLINHYSSSENGKETRLDKLSHALEEGPT
jgi:hypothetical protein